MQQKGFWGEIIGGHLRGETAKQPVKGRNCVV